MELISIDSHGFLSSLDSRIAEEVLCSSKTSLPRAQRWRISISVVHSTGLAERPLRHLLRIWWDCCGEIYDPNDLTSVQTDNGLVL